MRFRPGFPERYRATVVSHINDAFPDLLDPGNAQFIYPLAYCYKTRFVGNPYHRDEAILAAVVAMGDHFAQHTRQMGAMARSSADRAKATVDQRLLTFWLDAYSLVKQDLPPVARSRWEQAMRRSLSCLEAKLDGYMAQEMFNPYSFRTSPNHASLYACALYLGGVAFRNARWRKLSLQFMDRFVAFQDSEGYFPEGHGPVVAYGLVSLAGVARLARLTGRKTYLATCEKFFRFLETATYPDFTDVALIDRRMRWRSTPFIWSHFAFSHLPAGRAFARAAFDAWLKQGFQAATRPAELSARMLESFVHWTAGRVGAYKPWTGSRWLGRFAHFTRDRSWQYNMAVNPVVVPPQSRFRLDYHCVYSIWHQAVGLIVPGSQDKDRPQHHSFVPVPGQSLGVLHGGRIGNLAKPPFVEACYASGFEGQVSFAVRSARRLELSVKNTGWFKVDQFCFNMPLRAGVGDTVTVDGRSYCLTRKKLELNVPGHTPVTILDGKVTVTSSTGGRLCFPCIPHNPYRPPALKQAFLRLEIPVPGNGSDRARITLGVK